MFWRKPPPPPENPWFMKPGWVTVMITLVVIFVLGPVGAIYQGMTAELKKKADYETVILILKQQKEKDDRQWQEIQNNRKQETTITAPKNLQMMEVIKLKVKKLSPAEYTHFIKMTPEQQAAYKNYRPDITVWP